jgi:hypothetical protein
VSASIPYVSRIYSSSKLFGNSKYFAYIYYRKHPQMLHRHLTPQPVFNPFLLGSFSKTIKIVSSLCFQIIISRHFESI